MMSKYLMFVILCGIAHAETYNINGMQIVTDRKIEFYHDQYVYQDTGEIINPNCVHSEKKEEPVAICQGSYNPNRLLKLAQPKVNCIPVDDRTIISDVGQLDSVTGCDKIKYVLRNGGIILKYIIEPPDVDMSFMIGRTISITGCNVGKTSSDVSVIQMQSASTFG